MDIQYLAGKIEERKSKKRTPIEWSSIKQQFRESVKYLWKSSSELTVEQHRDVVRIWVIGFFESLAVTDLNAAEPLMDGLEEMTKNDWKPDSLWSW